MSLSLKKILIILLFGLTPVSFSSSMPFSQCNKEAPLSNACVAFVANSSVHELFNLNFIHTEKQLHYKAKYLNEKAWKQYIDYLEKSGLLFSIKNSKSIVDSYFNVPAKIISKQDKTWRVEVPLFINLQNPTQNTTFNNTFILDIIKDTDNKLKITQIQFNPKAVKPLYNSYKFNEQYRPFKEDALEKFSTDIKDLKKPLLDLHSLITTVNYWVLKQGNIALSPLKSPIVIRQMGILNNKYSWRMVINHSTIMVTRAANPQAITIRYEYNVNQMYEKGRHLLTTKNREKEAIPLLEIASQFGNSFAANDLGVAYSKGMGVKKDSNMSKKYYELAANNGDKLAMYNLGEGYFFGDEWKRDYLKAGQYLIKVRVRNQQFPCAAWLMGIMQAEGLGVPQNTRLAKKFFEYSGQVILLEKLYMQSKKPNAHDIKRDAKKMSMELVKKCTGRNEKLSVLTQDFEKYIVNRCFKDQRYQGFCNK